LTRPEGQKIGKFGIFRGKFLYPNLNQKWLTQPNLEQQKNDMTDTGQKILTLDPSLPHGHERQFYH